MDQEDIKIERVTKYSPEITKTVRLLAQQIDHNYKPLSHADVKEMLTSSNVCFLFFARDISTNQVTGMIMLLVYRIPYTRKGYIEDLIVDESFRGRGIGKALLKKAVETAKAKGAAYLDLTSRPSRVESNDLYEKFGFQKRETNVYRLIFDYGEIIRK